MLTNPKIFHGKLVAEDNKGDLIKLYNPEYLGKKLTGFWLDPDNELKPNNTMKWAIPVESLVYFRRHDDRKVKIDDLRGLSFLAEFERLGIHPKKNNVSYNDRNAAQQSKPITIPIKMPSIKLEVQH